MRSPQKRASTLEENMLRTRTHLAVVPLLTALVVLSSSCGSSDENDPGTSGAGGTAGASGSAGFGGTTNPDAGDSGGSFLDGSPGDGGDGCEENVRPIFVLTQGTPSTIHSFDPQTLSFASVVDVVCPDTADWVVSSMSVDRSYHAWVEWGALANGQGDPYSKRLDRIDLATGNCEPDFGKLPSVDEWATPLGMAFVSDANGSAAERLFFVDNATKLYPLAGTAPLGPFYEFKPGEGTVFSGVELTGTGEGRLFTMIMNWTPEWDHPCTAANPCPPTVHVGEVDKTNGSAISNVEVPDVEAMGISPGGFAFAHWGGHFWIFISKDFGPTKVYDYDPVAISTSLAMSDGPDGVVGAGVSTCAPLEFPK